MNSRDPFAEFLNEDLGVTDGTEDHENLARRERANERLAAARERGFKTHEERGFFEPCQKCHGTGMTRWGVCFRCKGAKGRTFKTAPAVRAQQRAQSAVKAETKRVEKAQATSSWREAHKAEIDWLNRTADRQHERAHRGQSTWAFPMELAESLAQWGTLTDNQIGAIRKCMAKDAERAAQRQAETANAPAVDVSRLEAAFAKARGEAARDGEGIKWLRLLLDTFTFLDAPAKGQWAAAILVREGDAKLGRIQNGRFQRASHACDNATEARVLAAIADPAAAARAFGQRTGVCSCCGAELTNAESRARGIGPICAGKWGL